MQTYTAVRANMLIDKWLDEQEELRYRESLKHPDRVCVRRKVKSFIEESKTIPVGRFIPVEFSQAYQDETTDVDD